MEYKRAFAIGAIKKYIFAPKWRAAVFQIPNLRKALNVSGNFMKTFIPILFASIFAACNLPSGQSRVHTKSDFVSDTMSKSLQGFFTPFRYLTFQDSIKVDFNVVKSEDFNNIIEISFTTPPETIQTKLKRQGGMLHPEENIFVDINKNTAFILWISEPFYNPQGTDPRHGYELFLKGVNLANGQEIFEKKIYSTKCCVDRVSMIYNPSTSSVLIAYNDFSRDDSRYLMYGFIKINENRLPENNFQPVEIITEDNSEKAFPHFIIAGQRIYLYHSAGDRWGFSEHTGKAQIGISDIDKSNIPTNYRILSDSSEIETKLLLQNDTLYYRVRVENENQPDEMRIKRTSINNLEKYENYR